MVRKCLELIRTLEERSHSRRFSVGRHTMRESVDLWTDPGQILDKYCANATTERLHVHSKRRKAGTNGGSESPAFLSQATTHILGIFRANGEVVGDEFDHRLAMSHSSRRLPSRRSYMAS